MSPQAAACVALGRRAPRRPHAAGTTDRKGGAPRIPRKPGAPPAGAGMRPGPAGPRRRGAWEVAEDPKRRPLLASCRFSPPQLRARRSARRGGPHGTPSAGGPGSARCKSVLRLPRTIQERNRTHRTEPRGSLGSDGAGGLHVGVRPALHVKGAQAGGAAPSGDGVRLRTQRLA